MNATALDDRRDLEALLPWYLNGTLSARERVAVESWLAEDEDARLLLDAMREEQQATEEANAAIQVPDARAGLAALMAAVDGEAPERLSMTDRPAPPVRTARRGLLDRLSSWLPSTGLRLAAGAACVLVAVQAAAIAVLVATGPGDQPQQPGFQVASGTDAGTVTGTLGPRFLLTFSGDMTVAELGVFLAEHNLRLVDSPAASIYEVELTGTEVGAVDVAALEAVLEDDSRVQLIGRSD